MNLVHVVSRDSERELVLVSFVAELALYLILIGRWQFPLPVLVRVVVKSVVATESIAILLLEITFGLIGYVSVERSVGWEPV